MSSISQHVYQSKLTLNELVPTTNFGFCVCSQLDLKNKNRQGDELCGGGVGLYIINNKVKEM